MLRSFSFGVVKLRRIGGLLILHVSLVLLGIVFQFFCDLLVVLIGLEELLALALVFEVFVVLRVQQRFLLLHYSNWNHLLRLFSLLFPLFLQFQPSFVLSLLPCNDNLLVAHLSGIAVTAFTLVRISVPQRCIHLMYHCLDSLSKGTVIIQINVHQHQPSLQCPRRP